jgi:hypothetical protein
MGEFRPSRPGERRGGRQKGTPNKVDGDIKHMVLAALAGVGGEQYLMRQADENPTAFLTLVGKVLPLQITGDPERPVAIEFTWAPAAATAAVSHETKDAPPVIDATPEPATNDTEFVWGKSISE